MSPMVSLRPVNEVDSELLYQWINDHDLVVFNAPFRAISRVEHDAWFSRIRTRSDIVFFIIENSEDGKAIGSCQLLNIHNEHRSADLQIRIGCRESQNRGLGSEAVRQLTDFGFTQLNLHRIALQVFANNLRAIRTYEKNGFVREGLLRQAACIDENWLDVWVMAKVRGVDD
jgi:RimJ/RimL family protein N-acetyltransferase